MLLTAPAAGGGICLTRGCPWYLAALQVSTSEWELLWDFPYSSTIESTSVREGVGRGTWLPEQNDIITRGGVDGSCPATLCGGRPWPAAAYWECMPAAALTLPDMPHLLTITSSAGYF